MITKAQYDVGINKGGTPWMAASPELKDILRNAERTEYLNHDGCWYPTASIGMPGVAYRIHPCTPYDTPGLVQAANIKGLEILYRKGNEDQLCFTADGQRVCIGIFTLLDAVRAKHGGSVSGVVAAWSDYNRPKGVL